MNFIGIDGVIRSPLSPGEDREGGFEHGGWVPPYSDDTVNTFMQTATVGAAGMLLGRRSFEILLNAWAQADDSEPAIAAMNRMPNFVVSSSPGDPRWHNSHSIGGDIRRAVTDLKNSTEGELVVFGAGTLVRGLAEHDLVDEYLLLLFPIILGAGKRMLDERGHLARFRLTNSVIAPNGVVILTYTRGESVRTLTQPKQQSGAGAGSLGRHAPRAHPFSAIGSPSEEAKCPVACHPLSVPGGPRTGEPLLTGRVVVRRVVDCAHETSV